MYYIGNHWPVSRDLLNSMRNLILESACTGYSTVLSVWLNVQYMR